MSEITVQTPTGPVTIVEDAGTIVRLRWGQGGMDHTPLLDKAVEQIRAYFEGTRERFDLPLRVAGSNFQRAVCNAMLDIPYGDTCTYGDIAKKLSVPPQAVGQACGHNPIPIIIPCHRVMGAKGLTGFSGAGGVETKVQLLRLEGAGGFLI
ncbi:methylated-DNA--[protein]-cysteine S-methyltransferase [Shimia sp. SDUM112013]|uniref:methylated-DNA--[protein]-cysteine S-methyltransferase n=1 Tax=Shimia sp. SDUM112013 TaxID=3136160 RepID=UPI0032EFED27